MHDALNPVGGAAAVAAPKPAGVAYLNRTYYAGIERSGHNNQSKWAFRPPRPFVVSAGSSTSSLVPARNARCSSVRHE